MIGNVSYRCSVKLLNIVNISFVDWDQIWSDRSMPVELCAVILLHLPKFQNFLKELQGSHVALLNAPGGRLPKKVFSSRYFLLGVFPVKKESSVKNFEMLKPFKRDLL